MTQVWSFVVLITMVAGRPGLQKGVEHRKQSYQEGLKKTEMNGEYHSYI